MNSDAFPDRVRKNTACICEDQVVTFALFFDDEKLAELAGTVIKSICVEHKIFELVHENLGSETDTGFLQGDFMQTRVPEECRLFHDIAISGNGEPTSSRQFDAVVRLICRVMADLDLTKRIKLVLITNGSWVHRPEVRYGLELMATEADGEVWFKVDSATDAGIHRINGISLSSERLRQQLTVAAELCPTWIQTCMFAWDGNPPSDMEVTAYLDFVAGIVRDGVPVKGVLLYGLARPSMQEEAGHLSALDESWMRTFADKIEQRGLPVRLNL